MQVDSDYEIINLDPNVIYESDDDEDFSMEDSSAEQHKPAWNGVADAAVFVVEQNKTIETMEEENKQLANSVDVDADKEASEQSSNANATVVSEKPQRKKLNLAEYKIVRANRPAPPAAGNEINVVLELCENIPDSLPPIEFPTDPRSIRALLMGLQQPASQQPPEQNKEVQMTEDAIKEEEVLEEEEEKQPIKAEPIPIALHPDYEEIIMVSVECNTDVSVPPLENDEEYESKAPAKFLTNIVNSIRQDDNAKTLLNSSTTLLSSINAVLHEKCNNLAPEATRVADAAVASDNNARTCSEHGENKVIMHLRKDRIRAQRESIAIQTDNSPLFPPLILSPALIFNRIKNARNFRRKSRSRSRSNSRSRSRSFTPENEYYRRSSYKYPRSLHSSTVNSSEFDSSTESDSSAYSSCRSSDFDSVKRFENRSRRENRNQRPKFTFQEERRIVYVGGLTEETSKEELRRKFLKYGTIKKISTHTKQDYNGLLRFGFITFAEAAAAYEVLDKFKTDPTVSEFDIRFGGRRKFCKQSYADLDSLPKENDIDFFNNNSSSMGGGGKGKTAAAGAQLSFEDLLNIAKRKLSKQT